jgi:peptide/nickel transport system substrate-binding protein
MVVLTAPLAGSTLVYFNLDNPDVPFLADAQVRQALYLALDPSKLIDRVLNGQGIPADGPFMPGTWAHSPGQRPASDPERAAEILAAAGWTDSNRDGVRDREGVDLSFELLGDDEALLQELAEQWRQVGVLAQPRLVNLASLAADYLSPRTFQAAVTHWQLSGDPDPYPLWHSTQIDNGQNYTGWSNEQADLLMEQGRSTNDPGHRIQLYSEFQRIFAEELPALPLFNDVYAYGVSDQVKDVEIGRLNWPWERFRSAGQWYIVTQRVAVEAD